MTQKDCQVLETVGPAESIAIRVVVNPARSIIHRAFVITLMIYGFAGVVDLARCIARMMVVIIIVIIMISGIAG